MGTKENYCKKSGESALATCLESVVRNYEDKRKEKSVEVGGLQKTKA